MNEEVTIDELRKRGQVVEHSNPNVLLFPKPKKCPNCSAYWATNVDFNMHRTEGKCWSNKDEEKKTVQWRPFKNNSVGEWTFKEQVPWLVRACSQFGESIIGGYRYRLSGEKFIVRVKVNE